jgi:hypothetical protein
VIWSQKWLCDSPNRGTKALEIGRNDLSTRERGNRVLILRDYIVSAASEINAGGGSNNDKVVVVVKSLVIDLEARRGDRAQAEQYALAA